MNKPLVPKLRFPEFLDAGDWATTSLNQITTALVLMADLLPLLKKLATGHEISGLAAYE